jgi:hypothetical protein
LCILPDKIFHAYLPLLNHFLSDSCPDISPSASWKNHNTFHITMEHWRLTKEPWSPTQRHTCSPWSQGVKISGSCGLTLESWKSPGTLDTHPGAVNAYSGDAETHTKVLEILGSIWSCGASLWDVDAHPGDLEAHPWALDTRPGAAKLTLAQLPLETPGIHRERSP